MKLSILALGILLAVAGPAPQSVPESPCEITITAANDAGPVTFRAVLVQPSGTTNKTLTTPQTFRPESDVFVLFLATKDTAELAGLVRDLNGRSTVSGTGCEMTFYSVSATRRGVHMFPTGH
jgi:hypothetical protein